MPFICAIHLAQEICAIQQQLSDEPQQGGETAPPPYGQPTRVTPERLALVIREQCKNFYQVRCHRPTSDGVLIVFDLNRWTNVQRLFTTQFALDFLGGGGGGGSWVRFVTIDDVYIYFIHLVQPF